MDEETYSSTVSKTIGHLAARWEQADKRILRQVFPLLAEGQPVPVSRISEVTRCTPSVVKAALEAGRAERDAKGRVVELSGMMLNPTMHRVVVGDVTLFSCCPLLADLIPALIGQPITVESIDPVSRRIIRLVITPEGISGVEPEQAVSSFVMTEAGSVAADVGANFCSHVHYFSSYDSANSFVRADHRRCTLAIGDLYKAAQMLYRKVWV